MLRIKVASNTTTSHLTLARLLWHIAIATVCVILTTSGNFDLTTRGQLSLSMSSNVNTSYRTIKLSNHGVSIAVHDVGGKDCDALLILHAAGFHSLAYLPMVRSKLYFYGSPCLLTDAGILGLVC